ncbi:hypothetical protein CDAR_275111 [Caerostris darwini]|uniref:Uncharacterized protein n=1 Tax=Caerostris darwini TaxID=1538125 RepID=A0AAV4UAN6_9ARAC|nr:hypothetical protein CDAR_275111 [Caerostris darwini]
MGVRLHACFIKSALCNRLPWLPVRVPREESALQSHNDASIIFHYFSRLLTRAYMFACESHTRSGALGGSLLGDGCSRAFGGPLKVCNNSEPKMGAVFMSASLKAPSAIGFQGSPCESHEKIPRYRITITHPLYSIIMTRV